MLKQLKFKGNGRGKHEYPYGPKYVYLFENATHSIQVYNPSPTKTNIHIAKCITGTYGSNQNPNADVWSTKQLERIEFYKSRGLDLYILETNGNLHLKGYNELETLAILKVIYIDLMNIK
jgi:hypothetical protein